MTEITSFIITYSGLIKTILIIILGIFLFIKEYFSIDTTSILIMACFIVAGVLSPEEGFSGFNNPATITVACMFVLSAGVFKTHVLDKVGTLMVKAGKIHYLAGVLVIVFVSGLLSAFINDTAVVAMLLPVTLQVARQTKISPGKLLMPLSFGALLGGICTLIGTSTNLLVSGIAERYGMPPLGMFEFTPAALWLMASGMIYLLTVGNWLMPSRTTQNALSSEKPSLMEYITEIRLIEGADDIGKNVGESSLVKDYEANIIGIRNQHEYNTNITAQTFLHKNDLLRIVISPDNLIRLRKAKGVEIPFEQKLSDATTNNNSYKLYELAVPSGSPFAGRSLSQLRFRQTYGAVVVGIHQKPENKDIKFAQMPLNEGNVLLVWSDENKLFHLISDGNLALISDYLPGKIHLKNAIIALSIVAAVVTAAATGLMPVVIAAMLGCLLMIVLQIIKPQEAYQAVEWKVIFMLAGVLSMGTALEKSGGAALLGTGIEKLLGAFDPHVALSFFFLITFLTTNVISNNASAALMTPIAINMANQMGLSERPFIVAIAFAASCAFMTPMSYQTNAMIYTPGNYRFNDYLKVGTPLNILVWIVATLVIPLYFPFYGSHGK